MAFYEEVVKDVPDSSREVFDACVAAKTDDGYDVGELPVNIYL